MTYTSNEALAYQIHLSKLSYSYDRVGDPKRTCDGFIHDDQPTLESFQELSELCGKPVEGLIIRQMTDSHIPDDAPIYKVITIRKQRDPKPTNFPPFREWQYQSGTIVEVRRSHWRGDLETGEFSATHGRVTDMLMLQCSQMVKGILSKPNFRGYSFVDEMYSAGMEICFLRVLKFNESKSTNPFSYITTMITNACTDVINKETKQSNIKKELYRENAKQVHRKFNSNWDN